MTAIVALVTGVLTQIPVSRTTSKGGTMATGSLTVQASADGKQAYVGLLAFNELAETLLQCGKGDAVSVRGRMELSRWTTNGGEAREKWQIIADSLLPGPEKPTKTKATSRPTQSPTRAAQRFQGPPPFDDEIAL